MVQSSVELSAEGALVFEGPGQSEDYGLEGRKADRAAGDDAGRISRGMRATKRKEEALRYRFWNEAVRTG
jgi:hypothetical protein